MIIENANQPLIFRAFWSTWRRRCDTLRQEIEKQLNKVELANSFTRAVAVGSPREFTHASKEDQEVAEACNRLIKNSIICWNALYLTKRLERIANPIERAEFIAAIRAHSLISWGHINMLGLYDFPEETLKDSVGIIPAKFKRENTPLNAGPTETT